MVEKPQSIHRNLKVEQRCTSLLEAVNRKMKNTSILESTDESYLHAI